MCTVQLQLKSALWKKSRGLYNLFAHYVQKMKTAVQQQILSSRILFPFPEQVHLQQLKRETINFLPPLNPSLLLKKK